MAGPIQQPYKPPQPQNDQFDAMRKRLQTSNQNQLNNAQASSGEAMQRRFAAGGLSNSGAALRAQQVGNQELTNQFAGQLNDQQNAIDQAEVAQNFQASEAQKGRDLQSGQFDQTFALDSELKRAQLGLARDEMGLKRAEQDFNISDNLYNRGFGIDMTQYLGNNLRDSSGRLINPNGQGLAFEESQGMYAKTPEIMQRRVEEENTRKAQEAQRAGFSNYRLPTR